MKWFLALAVFLSLLTACRNSSLTLTDRPAETTQAESQIELPSGDVQLPRTLEISAQAKDVELSQKINSIIDGSEFTNARWGTIVVSLKDGRVLAAREAQKLFSPASTLKLITTAAALDKLGADFRWKTSVYSTSRIDSNGTLAGNLSLYGRGAPDLSSDKLLALVNELKQKGLRRINGDIVGDGSYFRGSGEGDGWLWGDTQWYYGAQAAALTFNDNQIEINVSVDASMVEGDQLTVGSDVKPLKPGAVEAVGINREPGSNYVYVWGDKNPGSAQKARLAAPDPAAWAASELKKELERQGVAVSGKVRTADWRSKDKIEESSAMELASIESKTLAEVVRRTNKDSVNLYAELMLRTLGRQFGTEALDSDAKTNALRGDDQAGAAVIKKWLQDNGIEIGETAIHDGSGLSRLDLVSPETLARLLVFALQMKNADAFKTSLPVAGIDGTMRGRLGGHTENVLAKTGSITYVSSLAGYVKTPDETMAFVIFCNNQTHKKDVTPVIDAVASAIAEYK